MVKTREVRPRDFQIRKTDADRHGFSRNCAGCSSWFKGTPQAHTNVCRERFRGLMKEDAKKRLADTKMEEYNKRIEKKVEKKMARAEEKKKGLEEKKRRRDARREGNGVGCGKRRGGEGGRRRVCVIG